VTVLGAALFLAAVLGCYGKKNEGQRTTVHDDLIVDLDELSNRAPTQIEEEAPTSG
jgi:hypothetical protein